MTRRALVTLAVGDECQQLLNNITVPTWIPYAKRHGYDIVVLSEPLDATPEGLSRSPHWHKLLIPGSERIAQYEQVAWVDTDIVINYHHAPDIFAKVGPESLGAVAMHKGPAALARYQEWIDGWNPSGDLVAPDVLINTGVFVFNPQVHAPFFKKVWDRYDATPESAKENIPLSYELATSPDFVELDPRFNVLWPLEIEAKYPFLKNLHLPEPELFRAYCLQASWSKSFFLHFLGDSYQYSTGAVYYTRADCRFLYQDHCDPENLVLTPKKDAT